MTTHTCERPNTTLKPAPKKLILMLLAVSAVAALGCNRNTECERQRLAVHRAWESVHQAAYERKLAGVDEAQWTAIEAKTDLLQSAFATQQVTWDSANQATADINAMVPGTKTNNELKLEVFRASTAEAVAKQKRFQETCR